MRVGRVSVSAFLCGKDLIVLISNVVEEGDMLAKTDEHFGGAVA